MKPEFQSQFDRIDKAFLGNSALVAILNSHQSKRPCSRDAWVHSTASAIGDLIGRDIVFLTSVGLNTWELAVHLVNTLGGKQLIIVPAYHQQEGPATVKELITDFRLDRQRTRFLTLDSQSADEHTWASLRDELITDLAARIYPISLRKGGRLEELCCRHSDKLESSHRIKHAPPVDQPRYDISADQLNPSLSADWRYLTHWTRSSHEPYPGEDRFTYYQSILESTDYPNSAFHTLERIVSGGIITGSGRFIRGGHQVISLTDLSPQESLKLMRWRRRYVYYSFEPYGIAIDRGIAVSTGCRKVIYGEPSQFDELSQQDQPFFQNQGTAGDWRPENEWRYQGHLNLTHLPQEKVLLITHTPEEADRLQLQTHFRVLPLTIRG